MRSGALELKQMVGRLAGHFEDVLTEAGQRKKLDALTVYPGVGVVPDYGFQSEEGGGMGWVRLVSVNPTITYPNADVRVKHCGRYEFAYIIEVGLLRPAPMIQDNDVNELVIPTDEENFDASMQLFDDIHYMHEAIVRLQGDYSDVIPGSWTPIGPEGGLVGGTWTLTNSADKG